MGLRLQVLSKLIAVKHPEIGCDGIEPSSTAPDMQKHDSVYTLFYH